MGSGAKTDADDGAARSSAADQWVTSTREYFIQACDVWRTHPQHALPQVRMVVEGFVHAVCVLLEPTFKTHDRGNLRRLDLSEALSIAKRHLPPDRLDLVEALKNLGNRFHHNQGVVQRPSPNIARALLLQCAELLTWMDREIAPGPLPPAYAQALHDLEGAPPLVTPLPGTARPSGATPLPPFPSPVATPLPISSLPTSSLPNSSLLPAVTSVRVPPPPPRPARPPRRKRRWPLFTALALGASALVATAAFAIHSFREPATPSLPVELQWVAAYNEALESRDLDRIVNTHASPTTRFFMARNPTPKELRGYYDAWYRKEGQSRSISIRDCKLASAPADGSRAVQCNTYLSPPLKKAPHPIPTCLVFRSDGRLVSRTEKLDGPAPCPPPP